MPRKTKPRGHTGRTEGGNTKDVKVDRIGRVTIYKRGSTYYLYHREDGKSVRRKVDGNLAVAKTTAAHIEASLGEGRPSPLGFERIAPAELRGRFIDYVTHTKQLALRTRDRYDAALRPFVEYCDEAGVGSIDKVELATVEDFVRWLRGRTRTRNGAEKGRRAPYKAGGIRFVLSTCRTAFRWAAKRRLLPPYAENPFSDFPIDGLSDQDRDDSGPTLLTAEEEKAFFDACDDWQRPIFTMLATYGLRVGELVHLLVDDVDFESGVVWIVSKPWLFWSVKTRRHRELPLVPKTVDLLKDSIGTRRAGFVFLSNRPGGEVDRDVVQNPSAFRRHSESISEAVVEEDPDRRDRERRRVVTSFCRTAGQIPEKRIRTEFIKLTKSIGRPDLTRVHDLRHLFASRAQEQGVNPFLVQELLGHSSLDMTRRYTQFGVEAKRRAVGQLSERGEHDAQYTGCGASEGGPEHDG